MSTEGLQDMVWQRMDRTELVHRLALIATAHRLDLADSHTRMCVGCGDQWPCWTYSIAAGTEPR